MPHYLFEAEFSAAAKKAMMENPADREQAARPLIEAMGGRLIGYYFTAGAERALAILEAPDDKAMSAGALAVGASGAFTSTSTTRLMSAQDAMEAMTQAKTPWPRLGEGSDIAATAAFLAADEAEFITGQVLVVDGGALAAGPDYWGVGPDSVFTRKAGVNRGSTGEAGEVRTVEAETGRQKP